MAAMGPPRCVLIPFVANASNMLLREKDSKRIYNDKFSNRVSAKAEPAKQHAAAIVRTHLPRAR